MLEEAGVRRRVELAEAEVRRQRVEVGAAGEPVGEVDLVGVAGAQVLLDGGEGVGVRPGNPVRPTLGGSFARMGRCNGRSARESPLKR